MIVDDIIETDKRKKIMKKKLKSCWSFFLTPLVFIILGFSTSGKANALEKPQITFTTSEKQIGFSLKGSGKAIIDWGNGKRKNIRLSEEVNFYFYTYSDTSVHTIIIIGTDIREFFCLPFKLMSLDVSKNTALVELFCNGTQCLLHNFSHTSTY